MSKIEPMNLTEDEENQFESSTNAICAMLIIKMMKISKLEIMIILLVLIVEVRIKTVIYNILGDITVYQ